MVSSELRVECGKERQTVFENRAANISAGVKFRITVRSKAGERKVLSFSNKTLGQSICKNVAVIIITTGLCDHVEHAASRQSLISTKGTCLNLDFLNELEWQIGAAAAKCRVCRVDAVENVAVLRARRTGDRRVALAP